ncbi:hypothetical protein BASA81_009998 [Batrachochytrium salamandrivorans]|nr:hypothetical protein BASA81_009998 [Batrachochytrium salamandrivorans]
MGLDLCVGGTCQVNPEDGSQFCLCDSGYGPDLFTFHMANCTVPQYAFQVFFAMFSVLWFGALVSFVRRVQRARFALDAHMRKISQLTLAYHISLGSILVGYLLQGGMFEISAIFAFIFFTLLGMLITHMLVFVLNVSHEQSSVKDFENTMFGAMRFSIILNIGLGWATVPMMRSRYSDIFVLAAQIVFNVAYVGIMLLARKHINEFIMVLDVGLRFAEGRSLFKLQTLRYRVTTTRYYLGMQIGTVTVMSMPMFLRFVLGTMPFYYVILAPTVVFANVLTLGVGQLLEGNAMELKVNSNVIDLAAEPNSADSIATGGNNSTEPSSSDSCRSGYIVGAYKVRTSKRRSRHRKYSVNY